MAHASAHFEGLDSPVRSFARLFLRMAIGAGFLSAVADRFGLWGPAGTPSVAWGNFQNFLTYTARLNPWCPERLIPVLGWISTLAEMVLGVALILGFQIRITALLSGVLSLCFALAMTFTLGVHAPLNFSVFVCAAGSFLLAACGGDRWSLDALLQKGKS
ncbi:MAG: DoxX family protein [Silvibacterium sp.]|nr:DoxX family protein [Silvibacterium sp.]MBV8631839.1 DoxX family protein [Silvibacterium sp.]